MELTAEGAVVLHTRPGAAGHSRRTCAHIGARVCLCLCVRVCKHMKSMRSVKH